jgi:hypothetical protein
MKDVTYFASGSNIPQDVRGLFEVGQPVGIAVHEMQDDTELELARIAGTDFPVFLDSGAFSEVVFDADGPKVVSPITDAEWDRRLTIYERLAALLGSMLYAVAPDKIGFQADTLDRLAQWADRVKGIRAMGARILVPIQCGSMSRVDFGHKVAAIFGDTNWIPAFPCKKGGTSLEEIIEYVAAHRPAAVHLLGLGIKQVAFIDGLQDAAPDLKVFCDSMMIRPYLGQGKPLTEAKRRVGEDLMAEVGCWGTPDPTVMQRDAKPLMDYTDYIVFPSEWATRTMLVRFADALNLDDDSRKSWLRDPDEWLQTDGRWEDPFVDAVLDEMWAVYHLGSRAALARERHRRALHEVFGPVVNTVSPDADEVAARWQHLRSVMVSIRERAEALDEDTRDHLRDAYRRVHLLANVIASRFHAQTA